MPSGSSLMAVALMLTANTSSASRAINQFATKTQKKIHELSTKAKDLTSAAANNFKNAGIIAAPFIAATKEAINLESKIADVAKVVDVDFGSEAFGKLTQQAIDISNKFGNASTSVAELMAELAAGGVSSDKIGEVAIAANKISFAFDVAAGEAGKSFMIIRNAMNLSLEDTNKVMDAMNATTNKFGGKASELLNFMAQGGASVAQTLKVSGTDIQAFGNAFQVIGKSSGEAATTMDRFQKAILTNANLKKTFDDAGGGARGLLAILEKARRSGDAFSYLNARGVGAYSSNLAQLAANMNSSSGVKSQLKFLSNENNIAGSVNEEAERRMKTTGAQLDILKQKAINASIKLGDTLLPVVSDIARKMQPLINSFVDFVNKNPGVIKAVIGVALALASLRIITGVTQWFSAGMLTVRASILKVGSAFSAVTKLIMANPWMLIIAGIATAVFLIIKHWNKIKDFFSKLWTWVKKIFSTALKVIAALLINFTPAGLIYKHWFKIKAFFSRLWGGVKNVFLTAWEGIKAMLLNFTPVGLIMQHWSKITEFFTNLWAGVKNIFSSAYEWIKNSMVGKLIMKLVGGVKGAVSEVKGAIDYASKNNLSSTVNYVSDKAFGGATAMNMTPQLAPVRAGSRDQFSFAPVINVNGSISGADAQKLNAQMRRDFERQMADYQYNKQRKGF
ncbi:MAG: phage tail tape measure protein [Chitinophagaceae bacterium]|nr:phage tail tape measure protein [Chitinophagaceae bacterium]